MHPNATLCGYAQLGVMLPPALLPRPYPSLDVEVYALEGEERNWVRLSNGKVLELDDEGMVRLDGVPYAIVRYDPA